MNWQPDLALASAGIKDTPTRAGATARSALVATSPLPTSWSFDSAIADPLEAAGRPLQGTDSGSPRHPYPVFYGYLLPELPAISLNHP